MNVVSQSYPNNFISSTLRNSAWDGKPLGLYPFEGIHSDWQAVIEKVSNNFGSEQRQELADIILSQLANDGSTSQLENINRIKQENAFLVVTGQQIHLGLGPIYVIYKIASAIILCNDLNDRYPEKQFIPLFWMATEDHDVAEINHIDLFGDRFTYDIDWKTGVGTLPTYEMAALWDWMKLKFQRFPQALQRMEELKEIYQAKNQTLSTATAKWVSELFAAFGLLVLDPNVAALKNRAQRIFMSDLFDDVLHTKFTAQSRLLKNENIAVTAHARECNLFWMDAHRRERIAKVEDGFVLVDSGEKLDCIAMRQALEKQPERFSPNVLLRPLYQQAILPAIAYIAGPTEYLYWLQTTQAFVQLNLPEPALIHRMGGVIVTDNQNKKLARLGLSSKDMFLDIRALKMSLMQRLTDNNELELLQQNIDNGIADYLQVLYNWKSELLIDAKKQADVFLKARRKITDAAISDYLNAQFSDSGWNTVLAIQEDTFSVGFPQERKDFFLQYFLNGQTDWLHVLCNQRKYDGNSAFWFITV